MTGLVAYWKLDEVSGATRVDSSGNGNDLSDNNIVGRGTGKPSFLYAADFGASNTTKYLSIASNLGYTDRTAFSMCGWFKSETGNGATTAFMGVGANVGYGTDLYIRYTGGNSSTDFRRETNQNDYAPDSIDIRDGSWHFLCEIYDGSTVYGNIDARAQVSASSTATSDYGAGSTNIFTVGTAPFTNNYLFSGLADEVGFWNKKLSNQEIEDLYHSGSGNPFSGLVQYKSDGATIIPRGATTTESSIVFGSTLYPSGTSTLKLEVEVQPAGTGFTGTPNASSGPVSFGNNATTTFGTSTLVYPRDPESWSNGNFHWQARVEDQNGATSTWQLFGASTSTTDFKINTVPLYMQKHGPWPSATGTDSWADELYNGSTTVDCGQLPATSTIGYCGCTITDVVMWLRYFGIATDTVGNTVNPKNLNTWLTNNGGYDASSSMYWTSIQNYASSTSGSIVFDQDSWNYDNSTSSIPAYIYPLLSSSTPDPVILFEKSAGHWIVATGFAQNSGTSTYTVRDPAWYNTKYLNQAETSSTIKNYNNNIDKVRVYHDPPNPPRTYEYHVNLPNALMLVDSQGRRTGKDPSAGVFYHEIPGTGYGEGEHSGQLGISGPVGQYTLYILGGTTGSYWIGAWPPQEVTGNIQASAMDVYTLDFSPTSTENPKLVFRNTASSTASITSTPPHNLPLLLPQPLVRQEPVFIPASHPSVSTSSTPSSTIISSTHVFVATSSEQAISSTSSSP